MKPNSSNFRLRRRLQRDPPEAPPAGPAGAPPAGPLRPGGSFSARFARQPSLLTVGFADERLLIVISREMLPIQSPINSKKRFLCIEQVLRITSFSAMPRSILRVSI